MKVFKMLVDTTAHILENGIPAYHPWRHLTMLPDEVAVRTLNQYGTLVDLRIYRADTEGRNAENFG